jgi:hypothetical protein
MPQRSERTPAWRPRSTPMRASSQSPRMHPYDHGTILSGAPIRDATTIGTSTSSSQADRSAQRPEIDWRSILNDAYVVNGWALRCSDRHDHPCVGIRGRWTHRQGTLIEVPTHPHEIDRTRAAPARGDVQGRSQCVPVGQVHIHGGRGTGPGGVARRQGFDALSDELAAGLRDVGRGCT